MLLDISILSHAIPLNILLETGYVVIRNSAILGGINCAGAYTMSHHFCLRWNYLSMKNLDRIWEMNSSILISFFLLQPCFFYVPFRGNTLFRSLFPLKQCQTTVFRILGLILWKSSTFPLYICLFFSIHWNGMRRFRPKREAINKGEHFLCEECYVPFGRDT